MRPTWEVYAERASNADGRIILGALGAARQQALNKGAEDREGAPLKAKEVTPVAHRDLSPEAHHSHARSPHLEYRRLDRLSLGCRIVFGEESQVFALSRFSTGHRNVRFAPHGGRSHSSVHSQKRSLLLAAADSFAPKFTFSDEVRCRSGLSVRCNGTRCGSLTYRPAARGEPPGGSGGSSSARKDGSPPSPPCAES
jgi:hypothetical protein